MKGQNIGMKLLSLLVILSLLVGTLGACKTETAPSSTEPGATDSSVPVAPVTPESPAEPAVETPVTMEGDEFNNGAVGKNGGVSSSNIQASQVGIDVLKAGGNSVDAAVATAFAIGVVEPNLSGVGGCGMTTLYLKETNEYVFLEYMETVPAAVEPGWYNPETDGATAKNVAVPSQVHGLLTTLEDYGTMTREEVMAPAIKLAKDGFIASPRIANDVAENFDMISEGPAASIYLKDGLPYAEGDMIKNEQLAATLQRISDGGIEEYYTGALAQEIVDGLREGGSLITMEDMAAYYTAKREPLKTNYLGYDIIVPPPPSNGGDWLIETLNILETYDMKAMGQDSPEYWFTFNEASRLGLADSYAFIGDPAFYDLPMEQMTSKEYATQRATLITPGAVLTESPAGDLPVVKLEPTGEESLNTTHIAVIDQYGNIVSTTNTLGQLFGAKTMVPGLGFFFNSHMSNLEHDPAKSESPDYVMPGKRVRSTITPTIVIKDGEPIMAIGSPGSLAIPPAIAAVLNNVFLFDMNIQQAINAPRAFAISRTGPELTIEEKRFDPETIAALEGYGYTLKEVGEYSSSLGGIMAIYFDREEGVFYAGADQRRNGQALAY